MEKIRKQVLKMLNENNILPDTKIIFYLAKFLKERKTLGCQATCRV